MLALTLMLSAAVAALILAIKTAQGPIAPDDKTNWPLVYTAISLVASIVAAVAFVTANPGLFVGDPLFANSPILGALFAGFVSVLPGGVGSSILTLLGYRSIPAPPGAQAVGTRSRPSIGLWL